MSEETNKDMERLDKAVNELIEHFDTVQIFVTRHDPAQEGGTVSARKGAGDWYSRMGHVREWVIQQDEEVRENVRRRKEEE